MTKQISRQKISAIMKKAGLDASSSYATRIRGWRNYTSGVEVRQHDDDRIWVRYYFANRYSVVSPEMAKIKQDHIASALDRAGIKYTLSEGVDFRFCIEVNQ